MGAEGPESRDFQVGVLLILQDHLVINVKFPKKIVTN